MLLRLRRFALRATCFTAAFVTTSTLNAAAAAAADPASASTQRREQQIALVREWELKSQHSACFRNAYVDLQASCSTARTDKAHRDALALRFLACQLQLDGRHADADALLVQQASSPPSSSSSSSSFVPQHLYSVYIAFVHHVDVVCFSLQQELLAARSQQTLLALQEAGTTAAAKLQTLEDASSRASDGVLALHASLYRMGTVSAEVQEQLRGSVDSLSDAVRKSEREMQERVAVMLREHAASSAAISAQLGEARSSLGEISALSRRTGSFVGSFDTLVHYASLFVLVLIVTSTTLTAASRIPALVIGIVCPVLLERYALSPALAVVCFFSRCCDGAEMAHAHAQPNGAPVRNAFAILGALVVVFFALKHESPEVRQQRMLEEAIRGAFQAAAGAPSPRHHTASPPRLVDRSAQVKEILSDGETNEGEAANSAQASAALSPSGAGDDAPKTGAAKNGAGRKRK